MPKTQRFKCFSDINGKNIPVSITIIVMGNSFKCFAGKICTIDIGNQVDFTSVVFNPFI